ncbi:MAG: hypothetical protein Q8S11_15040 [Daejeonella sp.]|uniref:hypothetical protein n=1 Tax=Daejeonella sp. TaxID=2805397 RepID=UPI002735B631|nr:hypothetical protein [Daejeonella sp.]MDP3469654.1 hypothetical protein [Daejeonella sp.]
MNNLLIDQTNVDEWKDKYSYVVKVRIELLDHSQSIGYYKAPEDEIINKCINLVKQQDIGEARVFLAQNTWLGGDINQQIKENHAIPAQAILWTFTGI